MSHPGVPYTEYTSGATVKVSATFVNAAGQAADPTLVTAVAYYGPVNIVPPVTLTVTKDSVGHYHTEVATAGWLGPGPQIITVTWTGTGTIQAVFSDSFLVNPLPSSATDTLGP